MTEWEELEIRNKVIRPAMEEFAAAKRLYREMMKEGTVMESSKPSPNEFLIRQIYETYYGGVEKDVDEGSPPAMI